MTVNIKPMLDQASIALQKQAAHMFGAAVEDFTRGTLGATLGNNHTAVRNERRPGEAPSRPQGATFVPTSYAAALAGGTSYRPKMKFLFKVEFVFNPAIISAYPEVFGGEGANDFTFMVKAVDRPKIDFEYEDDVNMYNFRTKVLKKIRHRELTITFLDDTGNRVINFFRGLLMYYSPITRRQLVREGSTALPTINSASYGNPMLFSSPSDVTANDSGVSGSLRNDAVSVIDSIRIKQMYVDSGPSTGPTSNEIIYDFMNARIVSFDLDDLSHELSEASVVTMQFDYDWMEIVDAGPQSVMDGPHPAIRVPGSTAPVDMSPQTTTESGSAGGQLGPFARIIGGTAGGIVQTLSNDVVNKAVQGIAGKGMFGQIIGSYASNAVSGIVGGATRDIVTGASQVVSNAANSIASNFVKDSALGGSTKAASVVRSTGDTLGNFISNLKL